MSSSITSHLNENRVLSPSGDFQKNAHVSSAAHYQALYEQSINDPETFWAQQAEENLHWFRKWDKTMEWDFESIGTKEAPYVQFFVGGKINLSYNCLDRHLAAKANKKAIIWQGEAQEETRTLTYAELHAAVSQFANVLKRNGAKRGSTVTIYMPMIPEVAIAMLACARIGAIHSVVFSAFSSDSLKSRINDCQSSIVITSDVSFHNGRKLALKESVDTGIADCSSIEKVIVYNRGNSNPSMTAGRDVWWHDELAQVNDECAAEELDSEDPLFLLYTSGSTGKPKGVMHTQGGYSLYTHLTFKTIFDIKDNDVYWCTADVGWITGHSYAVYGPLSNGATVMMFEGVPTFPDAGRFWRIIQEHKVTIFYTAPTALRALMRLGNSWPEKYDLSSLRLLGSVGEPINPEAWIWYYETIGKSRCPVVDTWWQTENGGILITTLPGAHSMKPGSAGKPFFGVVPEVLNTDGSKTAVNEGGMLFISKPWPGMLRGVYGDKKNELIKNVYFSTIPGKYFSGDGCRIDPDGYHWLLGRIDDVINVSAHRFATAEIESALVGHKSVAESAVVGFPHDVKGQGIYCFVTVKDGYQIDEELRKSLVQQVRKEIGPIATPDKIQFASALPKTRSGKIMRRILRKIAEGEISSIGDVSTLADPSVVETLVKERIL